MPNFKSLIITLLIILIVGALVFPVFALEYNPGVKEDQYVKYGNFVGTGAGVEAFNDYGWSKLEVTAVLGKEISLLSTGQFKDGTAIPGNGTIDFWNIETGTQNGVSSTQGPIIAANLNQGDAIPPANTYVVNRTENRLYLGVSRNVNILETTISTPDYSTSFTYVYDRASGFLLESLVKTVQNQPQLSTSEYSYSVAETNLFSQKPSIGDLSLVFVIAVIAVIVVIVIAVGLVLSRRTRYN